MKKIVSIMLCIVLLLNLNHIVLAASEDGTWYDTAFTITDFYNIPVENCTDEYVYTFVAPATAVYTIISVSDYDVNIQLEDEEGDVLAAYGNYSDENDDAELTAELTKGDIYYIWTSVDGSYDSVSYTMQIFYEMKSGYYTYDAYTNDCIITAYSGSASAVTIPSTLGGKNVIGIGPSAFRNNTTVKSVVIPSCVKTISDYCFRDCSSLSSVTMHEGLATLGSYAFSGTAVTAVEIPSTVKELGTQAFSYCSSLTSVTLHEGLEYIKSSAFRECTALTEVSIPNSCYRIGAYGFRDCTSLKQIEIGSGLQILNTQVFRGCTSISEIVLPEGFLEIGSYVFRECTALSDITFLNPNTVFDSNEGIFQDCTAFTIHGYEGSSAQTYAETYSMTFEVINAYIPIQSFELKEARLFLSVGETYTLTPVFYPSNATNQEILWQSEDNTIVSVSEDGIITAQSTGTVSVHATVVDNKTTFGCSTLVVVEPLPTPEPKSMELIVRASQTTASIGDVIDFSVILGPISDISNMQFDLFLPDALAYVDGSAELTNGLMDTMNAEFLIWNDSAMRFLYICKVTNPGYYVNPSDLLLMSFSCEVLEYGTHTVSLTETNAGDGDINDIHIDVITADVYVPDPTNIPETTDKQLQVYEPIYEYVRQFKDNYTTVYNNGVYSLVDTRNNQHYSTNQDGLGDYSENIITTYDARKSEITFSNLDGYAFTLVGYKWAGEFLGGKCVVVDSDGMYGLIDTEGNFIIDCIYDEIVYDTSDTVLLCLDSSWTSVTLGQSTYSLRARSSVPELYNPVLSVTGEHIIASNGTAYGILTSGNIQIIDFQYDLIRDAQNGLFVGYYGDLVDLIELDGTVTATLTAYFVGGYSENKIAVFNGTKFFYVDKSGRTIVNVNIDDIISAEEFHESYAVINVDGKGYTYIDTSGNIVADSYWDYAARFSEGYALVMNYFNDNDGNSLRKWSIIDTEFNIVMTLEDDLYIDSTDEHSTDFSNGYVRTIDRDTNLMGFIRLDTTDFTNDSNPIGDINEDGYVTQEDSTLLAQYFAGWDVQISEEAADVNADGLITRRDAMILSRHVARWAGYTLPHTQALIK